MTELFHTCRRTIRVASIEHPDDVFTDFVGVALDLDVETGSSTWAIGPAWAFGDLAEWIIDGSQPSELVIDDQLVDGWVYDLLTKFLVGDEAGAREALDGDATIGEVTHV